ncbi:MAG: hypothetical protein K6E51_09585 [Treponema sp.]|nr:hypothetical protein [Treponema sp.]
MNCSRIFLSSLLLPLLILPLSCKKKQAEQAIDTTALFAEKETTHTWYYVTNTGYNEIDLPQNAPEVFEQPWTESIRIASIVCAAGDGQKDAPAYALVNRVGIITFNDSSLQFHDDNVLFSNSTATQLVFVNNAPVFSLYRNSFFNTNTAEKATQRPFLVQYNPEAQLFYPLISYDNLKLPESAEITSYTWNGTKLYVSIKQNTPERILFSYLKVTPLLPLQALNPATAQNKLTSEKMSAEQFRVIQDTVPFQKAPEKLQTLLKTLPDSLGFYIDCSQAGGTSPITYIHAGNRSADTTIIGKAVIADTWTAAIFSDGTVYLCGALSNRTTLLDGSPISFRLPKLPVGYQYGDFAISGTTLYVAWEETSFYKTGRAGFIQIDMDTLLYHNTALREHDEP